MPIPGNYSYAQAVTASDTADLPQVGASIANAPVCDALYIGGAGNVTVLLEDNTALTFAVIAGQILPIRARRVKASGLTASGLVALYYR